MRRVLMIVHDFPPMGEGAVMRTLKFAKYLPEFGWSPVVLTLQEAYYPPDRMDRDLLNELPSQSAIYRTRCFKPEQRTKSSVKNSGEMPRRSVQALLRCKRWLYQRFFIFQDEGFLWHPYAIRAIHEIARAQAIDAILTSSPPHNVHLLGAEAQRIVHVPWVADFRDGWTDDPWFRSRSRIRNAIERGFERQVIKQADAVIIATEQISTWFASRYGAEFSAKSSVIFNGFDPADLPSAPARTAGDADSLGTLSIAYVGSTGGTLSIRSFLTALNELAEQSDAHLPGIRVEFVGTIYDEERDLAVNTPGVRVTAHLPHREAVERMIEADVLLLVNAPERPEPLTGKLFEYIAARRPILALTGSGYLSEFIKREQLGVVVPPDDHRQIRDALLRLWEQKRTGQLAVPHNPELLARFNRRDQARTLAEVLDGLVA